MTRAPHERELSRLGRAPASVGIRFNHFARTRQRELKVVPSGQLVLIPVAEPEGWVQRSAHPVVQLRSPSA